MYYCITACYSCTSASRTAVVYSTKESKSFLSTSFSYLPPFTIYLLPLSSSFPRLPPSSSSSFPRLPPSLGRRHVSLGSVEGRERGEYHQDHGTRQKIIVCTHHSIPFIHLYSRTYYVYPLYMYIHPVLYALTHLVNTLHSPYIRLKTTYVLNRYTALFGAGGN